MTPYKFNGDATQQPQERVQQSQAKTRDRPSRVVRWIMKKTLQGVEGKGREEDVFDFFVLFGEKRGL